MSLAGFIDHTNLRPDSTLAEIEKICKEAVQNHFAAVCVPPYYIKNARQLIGDANVKVATAIGFPMGYSATAAKVEEIKRAVDDGADELDVVVNICAIKNGDWNFVQNDIESMTRAAHLKGKVVKVIVEAALLTGEELAKVCQMCEKSGVNFVKTSTGINTSGATPELIRTLRSLLPKSVKIKASGGIKSHEEALKLKEAGADRIGTSAGIEIMKTA